MHPCRRRLDEAERNVIERADQARETQIVMETFFRLTVIVLAWCVCRVAAHVEDSALSLLRWHSVAFGLLLTVDYIP